MKTNTNFHIESPFARGLARYFRELEGRLDLRRPVEAWIAGGMAVNLYTGQRITGDIDVEFSIRIMPPRDLVIEVDHSDGQKTLVWLDSSYNPMFALLHEDYQHDAIPLDLGIEKINTYVLTPVDLAVSKIARFSDIDRQDILDLARLGLLEPPQLATRAHDALIAYPGSTATIIFNLRDALNDIRDFAVDHIALYQAATPESQLIAAVIRRDLAKIEQKSGAAYSAETTARIEVRLARDLSGPPGAPGRRLIELIDARAAAGELQRRTPPLAAPTMYPQAISSVADAVRRMGAPGLASSLDRLARVRAAGLARSKKSPPEL